MRIEPEISGVNVVLLGHFNPAIFTPAWFALQGTLPKQAADTAQLQVAHQELTVFSTEWLRLRVTKERFGAGTRKAPYIRVRDLLVRVFKEHLPHTPLKAFGINRDAHFPAGQTERDRIGRSLAPVEPWGRWKDELGLDRDHGGMKSLTMSRHGLSNRPAGGQINVTVEPSKRIADSRFGIYVTVNDHYEIASDNVEGREQLMGFLEGCFESSIRRSDAIIDHIMSL